MRFALSQEQVGFGRSLSDLLARSDSVAVARAWARGETEPGRDLWQRLTDQGLSALMVPDACGGLGGTPVDLVVTFEALGHGLAVGPWIESAAYLATALTAGDLESLTAGAMCTVAAPPQTPYALDADVADAVFLVQEDAIHRARPGKVHASVDSTRRLVEVSDAGAVYAVQRGRAFDHAALACAAELLGCGERLLAETVSYAKQRRQFGREIGSYQAIKHTLADVRIALDFARPLLYGAALGLESLSATRPSTTADGRDVSAAKVAASDAAYLASRAALQVHGAIGYTAELDLGLWICRVRALVSAWGTPSYHRTRVLRALAPSNPSSVSTSGAGAPCSTSGAAVEQGAQHPPSVSTSGAGAPCSTSGAGDEQGAQHPPPVSTSGAAVEQGAQRPRRDPGEED